MTAFLEAAASGKLWTDRSDSQSEQRFSIHTETNGVSQIQLLLIAFLHVIHVIFRRTVLEMS